MLVQQEDKTDIIEIPDEPLEGELLTNKFDIAFKSPLVNENCLKETVFPNFFLSFTPANEGMKTL